MSNIELIEMIIQKYKPEGVYKLLLDIQPTSGGRIQYYIEPQYIIDKNDPHEYIKLIDKDATTWRTKGDPVYQNFEENMIKFIKRVTNIDVYFKGRGVTEKSYWESKNNKNS